MRAESILEAVGNTPLVRLPNSSPKPGVRLWAKLEGNNPTGSVKDRIAKKMIEAAEASGELTAEKIILEPTSGNTGIALGMIAKLKGYRLSVVLPGNAGRERIQLSELFGAEVVYSPAQKGTNGSIEIAQAIAAAEDRYYVPFQYGNENNPLAHYEGTGAEIARDLPEVTHFIAGFGTGGTLMGVGRRLREHNPAVRIISAEPAVGELVCGLRSLEEGFVPPIFDPAMLDAKFLVSASDSLRATRDLAEREGIFAGFSSGAVVHVAQRVAKEIDEGDVVCLLADGGWKYLSGNAWSTRLEEAGEGASEPVRW